MKISLNKEKKREKSNYGSPTSKLAFHLTIFSLKPIGNHGRCPPRPLSPPVALGLPFKRNAPGRHITGDARCAFFGEIRARRGGMHKFLMLVNTTIFFKDFIPPAQLDRPQNDQIALPLRSPPVARPVLSLPRRARVFLVDCCVCFIGRRSSNATMYFIFYFFRRSIRRPERRDNTPPHIPPRSRLLTDIPPTAIADYRLVVVSPHPVAATLSKPKAPSLSLFSFFGRSIRPPKRRENAPPLRYSPARHRTHLLTFNAADLRLVVVSIHRVAAT
jgi:hypothetical protein